MATATATATKAATNGHSPSDEVAQIQIDQIGVETLRIPIVGTSPLVVHRFSEKAKRQMLDNMQGRKSPKERKDPTAEYEAAFYRFPDGAYGFPAIAFKSATIGGGRYYGSLTMTELRQYLFFQGRFGVDGQQLVPIVGDPRMREDVVRVGRGTDLRYRPEFADWTAVLQVKYVKSALTRGSVLSLVDAGGLGIGVGEWRPEKRGEFGTYRIDPDLTVEVVE